MERPSGTTIQTSTVAHGACALIAHVFVRIFIIFQHGKASSKASKLINWVAVSISPTPCAAAHFVHSPHAELVLLCPEPLESESFYIFKAYLLKRLSMTLGRGLQGIPSFEHIALYLDLVCIPSFLSCLRLSHISFYKTHSQRPTRSSPVQLGSRRLL